MKDKWINIGCACNNSYAQHMGVMMCSLLYNCSTPSKVRFYVIDGKISKINKQKLTKLVRDYNSSISFIVPDRRKIESLKTIGRFGEEVYYRFFLLDIPNINKILYLDCDLIINSDITNLFSINLGKSVLGAVKERGINLTKNKSLFIPDKYSYFNSGVMLINCKKWRKNKNTIKIFQYIKDYPERIILPDQDGLNAILYDNWKEVSPSWNVINNAYWKEVSPSWNVINNAYYKYYYFSIASEYYNSNRLLLKETIKNAKIIHFTGFGGELKPWSYLSIHPLKERYFFYLKKTPWSEYHFPDKNVFNFMLKILLFFRLYVPNFFIRKIKHLVILKK